MNAWTLPTSAILGGKEYEIVTDYRDILDVIKAMQDPGIADFARSQVVLSLFYEDFDSIPPELWKEAMQFMAVFINCGEEVHEDRRPHPKLIDWDQDRQAIVTDISRITGTDIRGVEYLHWWTFVAYYGAIGDGQLATLVSIRQKRSKGKKLEQWEKEFYAEHQDQIDFRPNYTAEEIEEQERLKKLLGE